MAARPAKFLADSVWFFRRAARHSFRNPAFAFGFPTVIPLAMVVIFSQVFGAVAHLPGFPSSKLIVWMAPGVLFLTPMMGAGFAATELIADARNGYLDRLRILPINPMAMLVGGVAYEGVRVLVPVAVVLAASIAMGASFSGGVVGLVGVLAMVAAWSIAYNGLFYVGALKTLDPQIGQAMLPLFVPFLLTSTVFVPRALMPSWLRTVSDHNPLSLVVEAGRPLVTGGAFSWSDFGVAAAVVVGLIVVFQAMALTLYRKLVAAD
ncbi:MAG TPA: ABC transporter permease [Acidimicrobiales bacterium]|jgi:ABC-2 type transport system permease protein|nr:ABC transporter permease [Acidimicrobiales bacterium]